MGDNIGDVLEGNVKVFDVFKKNGVLYLIACCVKSPEGEGRFWARGVKEPSL